jgi:hypothetical protein
MPLENALSRWRESMADEYALKSTGKSEAFASAFTLRIKTWVSGSERWLYSVLFPPLGYQSTSFWKMKQVRENGMINLVK